jgi:sugar phosphate isomerase/epimerase
VTFGTGQLDLPAILREARKIGVKYYFIEDESPVSEKQIPDSLRYLQDVKD